MKPLEAALIEEHEAELRTAVEDGFIPPEEVEPLREELRRRGGRLSPLELLVVQGIISEQTLAEKRQSVLDSSTLRARKHGPIAPQESSMPPKEDGHVDPAFPVPSWDRYRCVRFLGQGGMGQVFLAYDLHLRRNVALKFVKGDDTELVRRLLSEARAQARVEHERVCKVHEVGEIEGRPYIAMQFIDGVPLGQLLGTLTVEQKALVLRDAAEGVHAAHRAGIIHRDLKPSNILVEQTDDRRLKPYVVDFGLAHDWSDKGTLGSGNGTPQYMSPEQARGELSSLDRRADVYSLGATLYVLLTGQPPIPGANSLAVLSNIPTVEPRPPCSINPDIPKDLEAIVLKCLEKNRSNRYDSVRALIEDLDRFLSGEPVKARPVGPWGWLRKKTRKHRLVVSVATVALLAVILAFSWAAYIRTQASRLVQIASRFTLKVERIEALSRYSGLSNLHDTRADRAQIRAHMNEVEAEILDAGELAVGPGQYALGRGYLALGDKRRAREHLEAAWQSNFHEPRVAWALALVLGQLYQEQLLEAERLTVPSQREARKQDIRRQYRDPALAHLRQCQGPDVPSTEYVAALIAFYEDRFDEALAWLDSVESVQPWFYEVPLLRGDILRTRAARRWNQGYREGARADFEAGRNDYALAASTGESVHQVYLALAELEYTALVMELYGQGDIQPPFEQGMKAVTLARQTAPENFEAWLLEARLHRRLAEARLLGNGANVEEPLQQSIAAARAALELAPNEPMIRLELGRSFYLWGKLNLDRNQDPSEQIRSAFEFLEQTPPGDRNSEFHVLIGIVFDLRSQAGGDPRPDRERALSAFLEAIKLDPRQLAAWTNQSNIYVARALDASAPNPDGDLDRAMDALNHARALNPQHVAPYFSAAEVQMQIAHRRRARGADVRPDLAQALDLYRRGLAINSRLPYFHNGVGTVLLEQAREAWTRGGDAFSLLDQAQAAYEQALALAPQQGLADHNISEVLLQRAVYRRALGESPIPELRASMKRAQQAITWYPRAPPWRNLGRAHMLLAALEMAQGRNPGPSLAQATNALRTAIAKDARHAEAWQYLGETRALEARWGAQRGQDPSETLAEAERNFQKAVELAPVSHYHRLAMGRFYQEWAFWAKERGEDASLPLDHGLEQAEAVLSTRPDWPEARLLRATLLLLKAETDAPSADQLQWQRQTQADSTQALQFNPHLKHEWERLRSRIRLLKPAPMADRGAAVRE